MSQATDTGQNAFAAFLRAARLRARLTQEELADEAGVVRSTIIRWEKKPTLVEPDAVRRVATVLGVDIREVVVALGYATREELALPPEPPRTLDPVYADIVDMLADPTVPARAKSEWAEYLRWQYQRAQPPRPPRPPKGTPRGTQKAAPASSPSPR